MDKITESLKKYLDSAGIPHQTLFNSDGGINMDYPTSTFFQLKNLHQCMSVAVDIFPKRNEFDITSFPMVVLSENWMDELRELESEWHHSGMMTNLTFEEEMGVTEIDTYCFILCLSGFCNNNGLEESLWKKYIERLENDTYLAWDEVVEIVGDLVYDEPNEAIVSSKVPF